MKFVPSPLFRRIKSSLRAKFCFSKEPASGFFFFLIIFLLTSYKVEIVEEVVGGGLAPAEAGGCPIGSLRNGCSDRLASWLARLMSLSNSLTANERRLIGSCWIAGEGLWGSVGVGVFMKSLKRVRYCN